MADPAQRDVSERARTPLLALITEESLDRDYQLVASRRDPTEPEGRGSRTAVVLVVAAFACLVTVAGVQTSRNADADSASRASLIERIEARRAIVDELQEKISQLREDNNEAEQALRGLGAQYSSVQARRARLGALTGFTAVTGPGVRVTLDNPPGAGVNDKIRDSDLALLADGLWAAGAEAIAINGQRLTATSAIRNSGLAVEVNSIGIAPPYTVAAIGDDGSLAANFVLQPSGARFLSLADQFGFSYDMDNVDEIRLPAAPPSRRQLRSAEQGTGGKKNGDGGGTP